MGETRDGWSKAEVIFGALGALGSIAIPIMLFVVGNRIAARQEEDSEAQLQADRVERMLGHLASTNADERRLAVNVVKYFSGTPQAFPEDLIPLLIEVASADPKEDVAATASGALEKLAQGGQGPPPPRPPRSAFGRFPRGSTSAARARTSASPPPRRPSPRATSSSPSNRRTASPSSRRRRSSATSGRRTRPRRSSWRASWRSGGSGPASSTCRRRRKASRGHGTSIW